MIFFTFLVFLGEMLVLMLRLTFLMFAFGIRAAFAVAGMAIEQSTPPEKETEMKTETLIANMIAGKRLVVMHATRLAAEETFEAVMRMLAEVGMVGEEGFRGRRHILCVSSTTLPGDIRFLWNEEQLRGITADIYVGPRSEGAAYLEAIGAEVLT